MVSCMSTRLRTRSLIAAAVAFTAAVLLLAAPPAVATGPGANGRISFMRVDDGGHWQVWTANPDLTAEHRITNGDYDNGWASWSGDGRQLAFDSARVAPERGGDRKEVFVMAADGSNVRQVTSIGGYSGQPSWSPVGDLITFTSDGDDYPARQGIYVVAPDGTALRRVFALPLGDGDRASWLDAPRFSPDGTQVAFTFYRGGKDTPRGFRTEVSALWVVDLDGSNARQIGPWGQHVGDADWSPDGARLAFETNGSHLGNAASVYLVDADGADLHVLTHDAGIVGIGGFRGRGSSGQAFRFEASFDPVWSPDGTVIMFPHDDYTVDGGSTGLQTIRPDGSDQQYVSDEHNSEHQVDWGTAPLED